MPQRKISRVEVLDRLLTVFRRHGYEGASLAMIAAETGLQKASLYHLFPGGKEEMAGAVLAAVSEHFERRVLAPLRAPDLPAACLSAMIARVREFYGDGRHSCLFETFTLGDDEQPFRAPIRAALLAWRDALAALARRHGASAPTARRRAERVLAAVQGSLVLARAVGDRALFVRGLRDLPDILLPPAH